MKLETSDLVGFIKERQRVQLRLVKTTHLAIVVVGNEAASASFIRAKQRYGSDIGVKVKVEQISTQTELKQALKRLSNDKNVTGIVLQLPLPKDFDTDTAIGLISTNKDVDGLGEQSPFEPATTKAIVWILASLSINLKEATVCVVGQGRLVGAPVSGMLESSGTRVVRCDINTKNLASQTKLADVVISGVGQPGLIARAMLKDGAIVIDAGTAEAAGKQAGDVDPALYNDPSIKVTPVPGGVGPMTAAALFDNLLIAASKR